MSAAACRACQVEQLVSPLQASLAALGEKGGLRSATFWRVADEYYAHELPWRRDVLGAQSVQQLCKSMIMENTRVTVEEAAATGRLKYVCMVLQYANGKLRSDRMTEAVRALEGGSAASKKQYNIRMVSEEVSLELSGFAHNAVTPLGSRTAMPLILSAPLASLPNGQAWLGGGEPTLKLRVDVEEFVRVMVRATGQPVVFADIVG